MKIQELEVYGRARAATSGRKHRRLGRRRRPSLWGWVSTPVGEIRRGAHVRASDRCGEGRFVGLAGLTVWVSYGDGAEYLRMCADFDRAKGR